MLEHVSRFIYNQRQTFLISNLSDVAARLTKFPTWRGLRKCFKCCRGRKFLNERGDKSQRWYLCGAELAVGWWTMDGNFKFSFDKSDPRLHEKLIGEFDRKKFWVFASVEVITTKFSYRLRKVFLKSLAESFLMFQRNLQQLASTGILLCSTSTSNVHKSSFIVYIILFAFSLPSSFETHIKMFCFFPFRSIKPLYNVWTMHESFLLGKKMLSPDRLLMPRATWHTIIDFHYREAGEMKKC